MLESFDDETAKWSRAEYTELMQMARHYSSLRFAKFTVFFATTGALLSARFGSQAILSSYSLQFAAAVAGLFLTITFAIFERVFISLILLCSKRAKVLETQIPFIFWTSRPQSSIRLFTIASSSLYTLIGIFWFLALIRVFK